ncbi:aspartate racemase [Kribbella orskensis]|uniref:Aspartate racemase n=1 Tax=Kribbella orskensis TaxID=2512216 RepID=A0ABY2BFS6_9ACTN|nr:MULTISPECIES: amino acid racemase [Kribbella]TCN35489.1 aspartate racemase [Kribbella sp. VKM Ac-2500]TCO17031.1 aspartate racemase [Kribbella orskensis]
MTTAAGRRIGVLGGMGPAATVDFYTKLIQETPAGRDQDHLPVVIWADPRVPVRSANLLDGVAADPTPWLRRGIEVLRHSGCDVLAVPCNTAHAFVPALAADAGLELVSIVDVTAAAIAADGARTVGLLATTGTLRSGLYSAALGERGVAMITPGTGDQQQVMNTIAAVKGGRAGPAEAHALTSVARRLTARGAEQVVAPCTELVLAVHAGELGLPLVDPARLLARTIVELVAMEPIPSSCWLEDRLEAGQGDVRPLGARC